jgi:hypothetical protein
MELIGLPALLMVHRSQLQGGAMIKPFKEWDGGHRYGWLILKDKESMAKLEFLRIDQPFHLFKLVSMIDASDGFAEIITLRPPDSSITFRNLKTGETVPDSMFTLGFRSDGIVALRDFRPPPSGHSFWESIQSFSEGIWRRLR